MIATCAFPLTFPGSDGDTPWVDAYCYVEDQVPAGCPVHIVTNDMPDPAGLEVDRWHGYNDPIRTIPSTTTELGSMTEHLTTSTSPCSCDAHIDTNLPFHMYEVQAALAEGDSFFIRYTGSNGAYGEGGTSPAVGPARACPTVGWPTTFVAQCGCGGDAGFVADDAGGGVPPAHPGGGCSAGGEPSLVMLGVALVAFARRRRRDAIIAG